MLLLKYRSKKVMLVPIYKWLICPISVSVENPNPQNTPCIPAVNIFAFLELGQISSSMDGHYVNRNVEFSRRIISG